MATRHKGREKISDQKILKQKTRIAETKRY